jgi:putative ABC transport system permease protein
MGISSRIGIDDVVAPVKFAVFTAASAEMGTDAGGIVLGVAVFVAMHTANRSIFASFDKTVDQIAGSTQLQISAGGFGFDESVLERVQAIPEVEVAVPIIETTVETSVPGQGSILVLGIDMTGDRSLRDYELDDAESAIIDDPLVFLAQPDSLMVTKEFAERNHLEVNSKVPSAQSRARNNSRFAAS